MNYQTTHPEWEEKIVAKLSGDLSPSDLAALDNHLHTCQACAQALKDYEMLTECLREIEVGAQGSQLPPALCALQQEIAEAEAAKERNRKKSQALRKVIFSGLAAALPLLLLVTTTSVAISISLTHGSALELGGLTGLVEIVVLLASGLIPLLKKTQDISSEKRLLKGRKTYLRQRLHKPKARRRK